jgi:hypothetical protein
MKDWFLLKAYKIMLAVGIIPKTEAFTVEWECRADGQCYVKTPFCPGRQPSNYGDQSGIQPGDTGICSVELVQHNGPSNVCFKSSLLLVTALLIAVCSSGCVMIVNYAPSAARASLYAHDQAASNMVVNQEIPVTAQLAQELTGTIGANLKGN